MGATLSPRLREIVDALPLSPGMRVLEIGCGTGAAAREIARRSEGVSVLAIDRSPRAIARTIGRSQPGIAAGTLSYRQAAIEVFDLAEDEQRFDLAFAVRVGALDGRHPELADRALARICAALKPSGILIVDGGDPLSRAALVSGLGKD
ncbi:class I SAM-dependent methyltransferase [Hoyosella sp. YIM 151337]|uniref:SAM-dependent methyltransferase n=1 Tax=Hoyosella sp. YIM 151337 TaxID=2992742 RepID=UPI00223695D9|nr:class I SAM-dependent methyltransferase [Hoyosella sp. YIM 151337]MCW4355730.1 class I SAM-dependent methyltransferase [Hoyosella sp. YIM 151337]